MKPSDYKPSGSLAALSAGLISAARILPATDPARRTQTHVSATFTFTMPKLTGRDIYRIAGVTPPPLIHHGRKTKARRKRKR